MNDKTHNNVTYLTKDGLQKLESELEHLRTVRRSEVASRLHQAIEDGELIENAEYEAAKNEQAFVEGRILSLSVGGIRASIYNAMPIDGVQALSDFMVDFQSRYR